MPATRFRYGLYLLFVLMVVASSGCVSKIHVVSARAEPAVKKPDTHDNGWWTAAFVIEWPEEAEPLWHVDLLVAHQVIWPVLNQFKGDIVLWRFHRRAMRDETGHQFSFIFYGPAHTAEQIFDAIGANSVLNALKASGTIIESHFDDTAQGNKTRVEDTSDPGWPEGIKKTWPYFIMGVSQTWLHMVTHFANDTPDRKVPMSVAQMMSFYQDIGDSVEALWREQGGHAFLHHLNGVFGYEEVIIYQRRLMTF